METYIIMFKDGTKHFWNHKPDRECFGADAELYETDENMPIKMIAEWASRNYEWPEVFKSVEW